MMNKLLIWICESCLWMCKELIFIKVWIWGHKFINKYLPTDKQLDPNPNAIYIIILLVVHLVLNGVIAKFF